ncbi:hypothetical protein WJX73_003646 [Symbiochloris irregularis]|uniref:Uncharacterized protein n=1 Tax=Symbiochloris irregularis TaxID=706552 RepID=A0AAW1NTM4_9CHLO
MRELTYRQESLWSETASAFLPPEHPSLSGLGRKAVQDIMQRRRRARHNVLHGQPDQKLTVKERSVAPQDEVCQMGFPPGNA